jgi:hypothetical protein
MKNYTDIETTQLVKSYKANPCRQTVDQLAIDLGRSVKSVIGKLSKEKVYIKKDYTTKRGEKPITKLQMVDQLAGMLQGDPNRLQTLEKTSKLELQYLSVLVEDMIELGIEVPEEKWIQGFIPDNS